MPVVRARSFALPGSVLAVALAIAVPPVAAPAAGECGIERHGAAVYERFKQKMRQRFAHTSSLDFEPYGAVDRRVTGDCVLVLSGEFSVKQRQKQNRYDFIAEAAPKPGGGWKMAGIKVTR